MVKKVNDIFNLTYQSSGEVNDIFPRCKFYLHLFCSKKVTYSFSELMVSVYIFDENQLSKSVAYKKLVELTAGLALI